jgi:hypothetical protein
MRETCTCRSMTPQSSPRVVWYHPQRAFSEFHPSDSVERFAIKARPRRRHPDFELSPRVTTNDVVCGFV